MHRQLWLVISGLLLVGSAWLGRVAVRAHRNAVTLHVRGADVRQVIRQIRWQTWEEIHVQRDLTGRVTVDADERPLEEVLATIAQQVQGTWACAYPLYSTSFALGLRSFSTAAPYRR
jgi:type II secretory pathway component GspD/PulD (secretin)